MREPGLAFLHDVLAAFPEAEWFVVGGAVRDHLLGREGRRDFDLVVRGMPLDELLAFLEPRGSVDVVGKHFGVLKFTPPGGETVDIAWPRTERAGGSGAYRDFTVQSDPSIAIEADLARRDFTMNAIAFDIRTGAFVDPFGGRKDIERRLVRAVGDPVERFHEDYSRLLRAVRFACELSFEVEPRTWEAVVSEMRHINNTPPDDEAPIVPRETVAKEMLRAAAADPVRWLRSYRETGALFLLIPELAQLRLCPQSPNHHSEGDVWAHTMLAISQLGSPEFKEWFPGESVDAETVMAVLLHDIAKPHTAKTEGDKITFYGHPELGAEIARDIAERLRFASGGVDADRLAWLVHMHLMPNAIEVATVKKSTLAKHFFRDRALGRRLLHLAFADAMGSIPESGAQNLKNLRATIKAVEHLEKKLEAGTPLPPKLLSGEDIMSMLDLQPGPEVGRLLDALHDAQLEGEITTIEQARKFIHALHAGK